MTKYLSPLEICNEARLFNSMLSWGQSGIPLHELLEIAINYDELEPTQSEYVDEVLCIFDDIAEKKLTREQARRNIILDKARILVGRNWNYVRGEVEIRDGSICQVCGVDVDKEHNGYWECGHKIDRVCGGTERIDNLVVMCEFCNQTKPMHKTIRQYNKWANSRGTRGEYERLAKKLIELLP